MSATKKTGSDQTAAGQVRTGLAPGDVRVTDGERDVLRRLSSRVAELAALPVMVEKRALWRRHNSLERTRPLVYCDPENGWNEVFTPEQVSCEGSLARSWELRLRREIFYGEAMGDDKPVEPVFDVGYTAAPDDWGMEEAYRRTDTAGSYSWEGPLRDYARDLPRLHAPRVALDWETTRASLSLAEELFGGILQVRQKGAWWWSLGLSYPAARFRGLDTLFYDFIDHPGELKELFSRLSRGYMEKLDWLEANGLLSPNWDGAYVGSGGLGYTDELPSAGFAGTVRCADLWGFTESQETVSVSPEMYEEFIFPAEKPLMDRFGLTCYGCCEPLHTRWHVVKRHHNLRRVSCSPWADVEQMAANLQGNYIYSMKPNPAAIATSEIDEPAIRAKLRRDLDITRGCVVEIIMKDNHTIGKNPLNPVRWCRIAREEAERTGG